MTDRRGGSGMACRRLALLVIVVALLAGGLVALALAGPPGRDSRVLSIDGGAICREAPEDA